MAFFFATSITLFFGGVDDAGTADDAKKRIFDADGADLRLKNVDVVLPPQLKELP